MRRREWRQNKPRPIVLSQYGKSITVDHITEEVRRANERFVDNEHWANIRYNIGDQIVLADNSTRSIADVIRAPGRELRIVFDNGHTYSQNEVERFLSDNHWHYIGQEV